MENETHSKLNASKLNPVGLEIQEAYAVYQHDENDGRVTSIKALFYSEKQATKFAKKSIWYTVKEILYVADEFGNLAILKQEETHIALDALEHQTFTLVTESA